MPMRFDPWNSNTWNIFGVPPSMWDLAEARSTWGGCMCDGCVAARARAQQPSKPVRQYSMRKNGLWVLIDADLEFEPRQYTESEKRANSLNSDRKRWRQQNAGISYDLLTRAIDVQAEHDTPTPGAGTLSLRPQS